MAVAAQVNHRNVRSIVFDPFGGASMVNLELLRVRGLLRLVRLGPCFRQWKASTQSRMPMAMGK